MNQKNKMIVADSLNQLLADTFLLYLKTHSFHWNVEGPQFSTLHTMFEVQYNELWVTTDLIAERIRALDATVNAGWNDLAARSNIKSATGKVKALDMLKQLLEGHEKLIGSARATLKIAEKNGDDSSVDLATQRLLAHEKTAWMLRATLA